MVRAAVLREPRSEGLPLMREREDAGSNLLEVVGGNSPVAVDAGAEARQAPLRTPAAHRRSVHS
jgi:hypothetical protein